MNASLLNRITKGLLLVACLAGPVASWADEKHAPVDVRAETPAPSICGTIKGFAGEARLLDASRVHLDDAVKGAGVSCAGWISVQAGWIEIKHRDGHLIRVGENSFVQLSGEGETLQLLRGLVHVQSFDDGAELRMATPNARARMKFGTGLLIYEPSERRSQWVTLDRLAAFENRFEAESHVTVGAGESSVLDLSKPRVSPSAPKAVTVASLKPILKELNIADQKKDHAIRVALERQRRVIPASVAGMAGSVEMRAPASQGASTGPARGDYHRHAPTSRDAKVERHLASKLTGGAPRGLLEPEPGAVSETEKKRILRELEALEE